jgi:hypothetical protein
MCGFTRTSFDTLRDSLPGVLHDSLRSDLMRANLVGAPNSDLNAEVETVRQILPQWATTRRRSDVTLRKLAARISATEHPLLLAPAKSELQTSIN